MLSEVDFKRSLDLESGKGGGAWEDGFGLAGRSGAVGEEPAKSVTWNPLGE